MLVTFTLVGAPVVAGWIQGHELNDAAISFAAIAAHTFDATAAAAARGPKPRLLARSLERALITLRRTA